MHGTMILLVVAASLALILTGCTADSGGPQRTAGAGDAGSAKFVHAVFFNLKPGTPDSAIESQIADAYTLLAKVPSVRKIDSGRRDARMAREVNDKTFVIGLVVYFDDKAGHDIYADHPLHQDYITRNQAIWESVRVFDYVAK